MWVLLDPMKTPLAVMFELLATTAVNNLLHSYLSDIKQYFISLLN